VSAYIAQAELDPNKYYSDDNSLILFKVWQGICPLPKTLNLGRISDGNFT
jgi:hypothetical protein